MKRNTFINNMNHNYQKQQEIKVFVHLSKHLSIIILLLIIGLHAKAQTVIFTPQWDPQTQFAGYYVAAYNGFFKSEGLNVEIIHPARSENAYSYLKSGKSQFITLTLSQALDFRLHGADLVNIMQTGQVNSQILIGHCPLPNIAALQNKTIGVWSDLNIDLIKALMQKYKLKAKIVRFNSGVNLFLSKAVDVCIVSSYNEFLQLSECGYHIDPNNVMWLSDWGYNMPGDGLYTLRSYYEKHKDIVQKFVAASKKGWLYAASHHNQAIDITMKYVRANHVATNIYHQTKMLQEVLRLQISKNTGKRTFVLSRPSFDAAMNFISSKALKYSDFVPTL